MKNTDIAKIRQLLKSVREMVECPHAKDVGKCDFCKRIRLLDEAPALLPCETNNKTKGWRCGGSKIIKATKEEQESYGELDIACSGCPDCEKKPIDK